MLITTPKLKVGDNCLNVGGIVVSIGYNPVKRNYKIVFRGSLNNFEIIASRSRKWVVVNREENANA